MSDEMRLTIMPSASETRILMTDGPDDVLMARLAPVTSAHHRWAAPMLLQALSTWQGRPVRVVLSADAEDYLYSLGLTDGLGLGDHALHYVVEGGDPVFLQSYFGTAIDARGAGMGLMSQRRRV